MSTFIERLTYLMKINKISNKTLSEKIGVTEATMCRYVNGQRAPKGDTILHIAKILNTSTDYLLGNTDIMQSPSEIKEELTYRIPKKPVADDTSYSGYICPSCHSNIMKTRSHDILNTPFCIWCGQALDWTAGKS